MTTTESLSDPLLLVKNETPRPNSISADAEPGFRAQLGARLIQAKANALTRFGDVQVSEAFVIKVPAH